MSVRPKLLYIDDEPENLVGFKVSFSKEYEVFTSESAVEGMKILEAEKIAVALVDFKMPKEDGISFIERIKDQFEEVIFIVISGYADLDAVIRGINMNCLKNFIQKPWNYNEMRIVLKNAVETYQIRKENKRLLELLLENNKKLQESMEREMKLNELKSVFLRNFSHEIRTPLNAIVGFASIARDETRDEHVKNLIDHCIQNSYDLLKMLESVILASAITTEQVQITTEEFSPAGIVNDIMEARSSKYLNNSSVAFSSSVDERLTIVNDREKIVTALELLIDNAFKFTPNGYIKVSVEETGTGEEVVFKVEDSGIGISREMHEIIFKPFRQCDESFGRKYGGNGLGLFISRSLIELLGGQISCQSEPGKGTTFSFSVKKSIESGL